MDNGELGKRARTGPMTWARSQPSRGTAARERGRRTDEGAQRALERWRAERTRTRDTEGKRHARGAGGEGGGESRGKEIDKRGPETQGSTRGETGGERGKRASAGSRGEERRGGADRYGTIREEGNWGAATERESRGKT